MRKFFYLAVALLFCGSLFAQMVPFGEYVLDEGYLEKVESVMGIKDLGAVQGLRADQVHSYSGEGEFEDVTDGFRIQFSSDRKGFDHETFLAYAKALWDKSVEAADDHVLYASEGDFKDQPATLDQCAKVILKREPRLRYKWYYKHNNVLREVELSELKCYQSGEQPEVVFCLVNLHMGRKK